MEIEISIVCGKTDKRKVAIRNSPCMGLSMRFISLSWILLRSFFFVRVPDARMETPSLLQGE